MKNKKLKIIIAITFICILIIGGIVGFNIYSDSKIEYIKYKDFNTELENGNISKVLIEDTKVKFKKNNDEKEYYTQNPNYDNFQEKVLINGAELDVVSNSEMVYLVFDLLFYIFFFGMVIFGVYKLVGTNKNTFKVVKHTKVKFDDIAGMDELKKEMRKIVDILKSPEEYKQKGIRQTKGIILEGAPGNGKTLFAKALAQEANVNFIATKGADFQSAIMSMGAAKIKSLFRKARRYKPCIIFIDEFDGIGERRNYAGSGVDKENNRIITAMLNEMDGFDTTDGILVIAATNSYNSLDAALVRPGRFDLKYNVGNPDLETRKKLIDLYTKKKSLDDDINKEKLADAFENLSCSAIETVLNEAAMFALVEGIDKIKLEHIIKSAAKTNCNINLKKLKKN